MIRIFVFCALVFTATCVEVEIEQGKLIGKTSLDLKQKEFTSFLSIPYAKPPLGELRFKAPQPPDPWTGVLNATTDLRPCPQLFLKKVYGEEDCLHLNVHTPRLPIGSNFKLLPVIFFVHGGAFIEGTGSADLYGADYLMPANVVLVTINYRLGMLGFMSSKDPAHQIPGNAGLKDQNMALKWVHKNIHNFGGDPNNVLLLGESAGGASVHLHMLSPLSRGLFHKVIAMSGTAANQWAKGILGTYESKAEALGITDESTSLKKFQEVPFEALLRSQRESGLILPVHEAFESSPVIETQAEGAFLTADPIEIITSGTYDKVPFMYGYTNSDGMLLEVIERLYTGKPLIPKDLGLFIPNNFILDDEQRNEFVNELKKFYYGGEKPGENNLEKTTNMVTDVYFISGFLRLMNATKTTTDNYFYRFSADTKLNFFKKKTPETANRPGACHVDDLGHIFKVVNSPDVLPGSPEEKAVENIVNIINNFAKTGKPTMIGDSAQWLPLTADKLNFMDISTVLTAGENPDNERFEFWKKMYTKFQHN